MEKKIITAAVLLALLVAAAVVYAHGGAYGKKGPWRDSTCNATKSQWLNATWTVDTRQIKIVGEGIEASLDVEVVAKDSSRGIIVGGSGYVKLGDATYTVKTIHGRVDSIKSQFVIYTGSELIVIKYGNGQYSAVVKVLGQPGYKVYRGAAQIQ
ncbi:MAG: hypothetical protein QXE80_08630 [Pyrobaculum sp.]